MDTLTHALSGAIAGRLLAGANPTSNRPAVRQIVATTTAAAIFPDLDIVLRAISELSYLQGHRGVTHSLLLLPFWAWLIALASANFYRWRQQAVAGGWRALYIAACSGLLIHILGDLITQFGTMILAPFSWHRFGWGMTFIIDPLITFTFIVALFISARWRNSRKPAAIGLAFVLGWIGLQSLAQQSALDFARQQIQSQAIKNARADAIAAPFWPFNWTLIISADDHYQLTHINLLRQHRANVNAHSALLPRLFNAYQAPAHARWQRIARPSALSAIAYAWNDPEMAFFRWFAQFPFLDTEFQYHGHACASFADLRFAMPIFIRASPFRFGVCQTQTGSRLFRLGDNDTPRWLD